MTTFRPIFSLASASVLAVALLAAPLSRAAEPLLLQWGTIDTSSDAAQAESAALKAKVAKKAAAARKAGAAAESRAAYVVQFPGPVADEWREWLESATQVRGYLPEFAYLVWATPSEMDAIAANENVFWTGEWKKEYKTVCAETAPAKTTASAAADEARWMQVGSLLTGDDGAADLRARLEALPATVRSAFPRLDGSSAVAFLTDAQIDEVASWPDVEWIEPKLKARLFNDKAARTNMMNVTNAWKAISSGGLGLTGTNQIVAVADTGCDKGSKTDTHADFSGRILAGYGWTNGAYKASASWADIDAHGTHVCGSVLGSGAKSSGQFRGMAYEAQLVMQGMWEDLGGLPDDTGDMLKQAYTNGARIHSDSWGFGTNYAGKYIYDAAYSDGYMWTNQNFIMVIAAGNDGIDKNKDGVIDAGSVSCPGTAKNCLCVGAAENYRSTGGYSEYGWGSAWSSDYPTDPIKSDKISQTSTPQGLAAFSGRGPTKDGRFKPDIVAPGTDVISVRSRMAQDDGWGIYTSNTNYLYEGGTSMATPLTSGALALVRQWLVDRKGINEPMAALMKALLINGARDMTPGQYGTGAYQEITARPDRSQGFGHVNLYNSLEPGSGNFLHFVTNKLTTGANFTTNINVGQANAGTYVLTLAWQDYPGTEEASKTLVNDLDLTVTSPSGTVYYPNNYGKLDHTNNVEFIEFTATETGTYAVKVNGYSVSKTSPHGGQPYALVMRGPETVFEDAAPEFSSATASTNGYKNETIYFDFSSLLTAGFPAPTYTITSSVASSLWEGADELLEFTPTASGTYTFTCTAANDSGTATCVLTVNVTTPPPATPEVPSTPPVAGPTSFTATWSAVSDAASYLLYVQRKVTASTSARAARDASYLLNESFELNEIPSEWTKSGSIGTASGKSGDGDYCVAFKGAGATLITPALSNPTGISFIYKRSSNTTAWSLDVSVANSLDGPWNSIGTVSDAGTSWQTFSASISLAGTVYVKFTDNRSSGTNERYFDLVQVTGDPGTWEDIPSSPFTVSGTSREITGLSAGTEYRYSVTAVNSEGVESDPSPYVTVETAESGTAPVWSTLPAQSVAVGGTCTLDLSGYVTGSPAPTLSMTETVAGASLTGTVFSFTPTAAGTFTFTFTANNSVGSPSSASLTVTATGSAPAISVPQISYAVAVDDPDVEFTVTATGAPTPTLALSSRTPADVACTFDPDTGAFSFTPSAIGTYTFSFTAANSLGSDSVTVSVTVSAAPVTVPTLTVTNVADTTARATWTACDSVSSYTLQLSTNEFSAGAATITDTLTAAKLGLDGSYGAGSYVSDDSGAEYAAYGMTKSGGTAIQIRSNDSQSGIVVTKSAGTVSEVRVSFASGTQSGRTLDIYGSSSAYSSAADLYSASTPLGTIVYDGSNAAGSYTINGSYAFIGIRSASGAIYLDNVEIDWTPASGTTSKGLAKDGGDGIQTFTVNDTSYEFTDLTPETTYYARVKGTSDWSNVETFTTLAGADSAPVWSAIPAQNYLFGSNTGTFEFNVAPYASGTPSPAFYLDDTPWTAYVDDANGDFIFEPESLGTFDFTIIASNTLGTANATLSVAVTAAPPAFVDLPATVSGTTDGDVTFTVTASGNPAPVLDVAADETLLYTFDDSTGEFRFYSDVTGDFVFSFTASNIAAVVTQSVTVTISPAPVTVPTLAVTNVTDTTALASWTACDGVSSYTLQLSTNAFPAASSATRSLTPILSEDFSGFTANDSTDISGSLNNYTTNSGWTGSKVYCHSREAKVGASSGQAWLTTPSLTVSGSLTVVWEARTYGSSDKYTLLLGISEDGTTFTDTTITLYDDMTVYTNEFTVSGTTAYVRWMNSGTSKARFYLDNVAITSASSGGGDDPGGDSVQTFTVAGTSYTFTDLTPDTAYLARVKGTAGWSETVSFQTLGSSDTAPTIDPIADQTYTYGDNDGEFTLTVTASGTPSPTLSVTSDDAIGLFDIDAAGEFIFLPTAVGTFHFTVTATNGISPDATASFAVTVTGTAPTLAAIADQTVSVEAGQLTVPLTVTGNPAPTVNVASTDAPDDSFCIDSNGDFYFLFDEATGTFHFTITAANGVSPDATASFAVTVTGGDTPVEFLELSFPDLSASATSFNVEGATAGHSYDFLWTTNLLVPGFSTTTYTATNTTFSIPFPHEGDCTWFGYVRPASTSP